MTVSFGFAEYEISGFLRILVIWAIVVAALLIWFHWRPRQ
jgi:hypothetical protein